MRRDIFQPFTREHCKVRAISKLYPRSITNSSAWTQIDKTFLDRRTWKTKNVNIKSNQIQVWGPKYKWENTVHYVDKENNIIQNVNKILVSIYILNYTLLITRLANKSFKDGSAGCFWIAFIEYVLWFKIILGLNFIWRFFLFDFIFS